MADLDLHADLWWLAYRYASDDMSAAESADFEMRLANDFAMQTALAEVVLLQKSLAASFRADVSQAVPEMKRPESKKPETTEPAGVAARQPIRSAAIATGHRLEGLRVEKHQLRVVHAQSSAWGAVAAALLVGCLGLFLVTAGSRDRTPHLLGSAQDSGSPARSVEHRTTVAIWSRIGDLDISEQSEEFDVDSAVCLRDDAPVEIPDWLLLAVQSPSEPEMVPLPKSEGGETL